MGQFINIFVIDVVVSRLEVVQNLEFKWFIPGNLKLQSKNCSQKCSREHFYDLIK